MTELVALAMILVTVVVLVIIFLLATFLSRMINALHDQLMYVTQILTRPGENDINMSDNSEPGPEFWGRVDLRDPTNLVALRNFLTQIGRHDLVEMLGGVPLRQAPTTSSGTTGSQNEADEALDEHSGETPSSNSGDQPIRDPNDPSQFGAAPTQGLPRGSQADVDEALNEHFASPMGGHKSSTGASVSDPGSHDPLDGNND